MRVAIIVHSCSITSRSTSLKQGICSPPACAYAFSYATPQVLSPPVTRAAAVWSIAGTSPLRCLMHFLLAVKYTGWFSFLVRGRHPMQQWEESSVFRQQDRTYPVRGHFLPFRCASHASCHGSHSPEPHDTRECITRPSLPATTFISVGHIMAKNTL